MKIFPLLSLPRKKLRDRKDNTQICEEFLDMHFKYAKVIFTPDEYMTSTSACCSLRQLIDRKHYPMYVTIINGDVYLVKTGTEG